MNKLPLARSANIVVQILGKEILIYDLDAHKAFNLNETSAIVYQACDGLTAFDALKAEHRFTEEIILLALDELRKENLLEKDKGFDSSFAGMDRREMIRKAGFASMIALPVIASLVAPTAAMAQSVAFAPGSRTLRQTCSSSTDCAAASPNCTSIPVGSAQRICCVSPFSYYDTGRVINSCTGGSNCNSANFACQFDANDFCCSGSTTASCSGNSCVCQCN